MSRIGGWIRHPFWQAFLLLILAYLLFKFGIAYLPGLLGLKSAPVPSSVVVQYMLIALVGILIHVSSDEARWSRFKEPIHGAMVDADKRWVRLALLILVPLVIGFATYQQTRPRVEAPVMLRSIHPAPARPASGACA